MGENLYNYKFCINMNSPTYFSDKSPYSEIDVNKKGIRVYIYYIVFIAFSLWVVIYH